MSSLVLVVLTIVVFGTMLAEAALARANERAQIERGGIEPAGDVYPLMRIAYPAIFAAMVVEGWWRGMAPFSWLVAGGLVLALSKLLKWSAIRALGPFWTFRVIVLPGARLVASGPYRYVRHPNYVGVIGEIAGVAMMTGALVAGPVAALVFGALLIKRLAVEEHALKSALTPS